MNPEKGPFSTAMWHENPENSGKKNTRWPWHSVAHFARLQFPLKPPLPVRRIRITLASGEPFGFAGLWDAWKGHESPLLTCCVITTTANELVSDVHERMPVIVPPESYAEWLDPNTPERRLGELLVPYAASEMRVTAAGAAVNSPKNDGPECLEAA